MNYVDKNLLGDEKVVMKAKISFLYLLPKLFFLIVAIVAGIVLKVAVMENLADELGNDVVAYLPLIVLGIPALFGFLNRILIILTTHLVITNKRLLGKTGVLKIATMDIMIEKIDNVAYAANFWGNLFHYYDLKVTSASGQWIFHGVSNAMPFKNSITAAIEQHADEQQKAQAAAIAQAMGTKKD